MVKEHVKDVINEEYTEWTIGDDVTIDFQTGARKTSFILEYFSPYLAQIDNSAILYLVSRTKLKKDIEDKIDENLVTNITVMTYQALENMLSNNYDSIYNYHYIACDECHYFVEDAWNRKTQISWKYIIKQNTLRIWMSGTGRHVFKFIENIQLRKKSGKHYSYRGNYDYSFIEKLNFFSAKYKLNYITNILKDVPSGEKAIYFCTEKKFGKTIYNKINKEMKRPALYYFSDDKKSNLKKTAEILNEKFDEDILIATNVIDTGISLKDKKIRCIITDIPNVETLVQCIGRKRLDEDEKIVLHICNYTEKEIRNFITISKSS